MTLQLAGQPIGLREISRSGKNTLTAIKRYWLLDTPQKTNIEPKKGGLEDYFPFQLGDFQVPCESSRVYAFLKKILYMVSSTHINMDTHHFWYANVCPLNRPDFLSSLISWVTGVIFGHKFGSPTPGHKPNKNSMLPTGYFDGICLSWKTPMGKERTGGKPTKSSRWIYLEKKHHYITAVFSWFFTFKVSPPIFSATTATWCDSGIL